MQTPMHTVTVSSPLRRLLRDLQIFCSADCCRERAFEITEGSVSRWLDSERTDRSREIAAEIDRVGSGALSVAGKVFWAVPDLESTWDADQFRDFWEHLRATYTRASEARGRATA